MEWTWQGGSDRVTQFGTSSGTFGSAGSYGTQNVAASSNLPPGRAYSTYAVDATGNLWLFGGSGYTSTSGGNFDDLWRYNISTKMWTWVAGSQSLNQPGSYGTQGVSYSPSIHFPGSGWGGGFWADNSGFLWLMGGLSNDLWKIDTGSGQVTWVSGSLASNAPGWYGVILQPASSNMPGAREAFAHWTDTKGNFWVFGGYGYDASGHFGELNDLWMFNPQSGMWTWENGSNSADLSGTLVNYGTQGIPSNTNEPGGLWFPMNWTDSQGNFWLYSGGATVGNAGVLLDDLWVYQPFALTLQSQMINFNSPGDVFSTTTSVAIIASASSGLPVSFASNTPHVCTVSGNTATITASGTCSITAIQAGNSSYAAATSVTKTFQVVPDFTMSLSGAKTITINPGGTATFNFALAPVAPATSFQNAVTLSYSFTPSLPGGYQVSLTPTSIASGSGPTNVTLALTSPASAMQNQAPRYPTSWTKAPIAFCLLLVPFMGSLRRMGKQFSALAVLIFLVIGAAMISLNGCGGSSSPSSGSPTSYGIVIMATSGSLSHSASVSLTVN